MFGQHGFDAIEVFAPCAGGVCYDGLDTLDRRYLRSYDLGRQQYGPAMRSLRRSWSRGYGAVKRHHGSGGPRGGHHHR